MAESKPFRFPIQLLTPKDVAERLSVTTKTLERWRGNGEGPRFVRLNHITVRYRAEDIQTFVDERTFRSTAIAS